MKKKTLLTLCTMFAGMAAFAQSDHDVGLESGWSQSQEMRVSLVETINEKMDEETVTFDSTQDKHHELRPSYLNAYRVDNWWSYGWFLTVQGGLTSFIGNPIGCSDIFDRTRETVQASIGKWIIPGIGLRANYQWGRFKNCMMERQEFHAATADIVFDPISMYWKDTSCPDWTVMPFVGGGIIHNENRGQPFSLHYGLIGSYRTTSRISLNLEIGSFNTFQAFDGWGNKDRFGDQLWSVTAGLTVHLGKTQRCKVIDAAPYIEQNRIMIDENRNLRTDNFFQEQVIEEDRIALTQYRNILRIEGLLDKYRSQLESQYHYLDGHIEPVSDDVEKPFESANIGNDKSGYEEAGKHKDLSRFRNNGHNNYAGFRDFLARMSHKGKYISAIHRFTEPLDEDSIMASAELEGNNRMSDRKEYFRQMASGEVFIGAPVLFFFRLGTWELITKSQLENLQELIDVASHYGLRVRVVGAADSATGSSEHNKVLSEKRAKFIEQELLKGGIPANRIETISIGGTDYYPENETNRLTRVELYF